MPDAFARLLKRMLEDGHVPWSQVSAASEKKLRSLLDAGVVQKTRRGSGFVLEVSDTEVLGKFVRRKYPDADLSDDVSPRARAVGSLRNAKRAARTDREPVLLRAFQPTTCRNGDVSFDVKARSRETGAVCLVLSEDHGWSLSTRIAVVENMECFLHFEKMDVPASVALYASGRLSDRVLQWLQSQRMQESTFIHCGDYDPVGLDEYLRLKSAVGDRAELYVPAGLKKLINLYGRPELIADSAPTLQRLRSAEDPDVRRLAGLLDETGWGLEQEVLLLDDME